MDLQIPEAATISGLLAGIIILLGWILRAVGQRSDPELIKLTDKSMNAYANLDKTISELRASIDAQTKTNGEQTLVLSSVVVAMRDHTEWSATRLGELGKSYADMMAQMTVAINAVIEKARGEHTEMQESLGALMSGQKENIETTKATKTVTEEIKSELEKLDQSMVLAKIVDKLDALQNTLDNIKQVLGTQLSRVSVVEADIIEVKKDVAEVQKRITQENQAVSNEGASVINAPVPEDNDKKESA